MTSHPPNSHSHSNIEQKNKYWLIIGLLILVAILGIWMIQGKSSTSTTPKPGYLIQQSPISPISPLSPVVEESPATEKNLSDLYEKGLIRYKQGDFLDALEYYNSALAINPDRPDILNARGNAFMAIHDFEHALDDYNHAISLDNNFSVAYYNRGRLETEMGNYEAALKDFETVIQLDPRLTYDAIVNTGVVYYKMGKNDLASQNFKKAIHIDPNQAQAYLNQANLLLQSGDWADALKYFDKALEIDTQLVEAYWGQGWAYYNLGDYKAAIKSTEKALSLNPDNATLYFNLGLIYLANNDIENALAHYQSGKELASNSQAETAISDLKSLKNKKPELASEIDDIIKFLQ